MGNAKGSDFLENNVDANSNNIEPVIRMEDGVKLIVINEADQSLYTISKFQNGIILLTPYHIMEIKSGSQVS